jgi:heme a synthase
MRALISRIQVTPRQFELLSLAALGALTAIVLTGAAVRLTWSGLGCPDWPRCYGNAYPPLQAHALIEFGNRVVEGIVGIAVALVAVLAFRRRPFRRDLALLALTLPLGVLAQAVLGGLTVVDKLAPGLVMAHFALSMVILIGAAALAWRARPALDRGDAPVDRGLVWAVRGLLVLAAIAIFAGTAATASGPHSGGAHGQHIDRLHFEGADTLNWTVHAHGAIAFAFGICAVLVWVLAERRGAHPMLRRALTWLCALIALQGVVGTVQFDTHLPTELVWVHVALASLCWLCALWAVAAAGRLAPDQVRKHAQIRASAMPRNS